MADPTASEIFSGKPRADSVMIPLRCNTFIRIKSYLSLELRSVFYSACIQPQFNYCNIVWGNSSNYNVSKITKLQRRACKVILENQYENLESALRTLNILSFNQNVFLNKAKTMYKVANGLVPQSFSFKRERTVCLILH